MKHKNAYPNLRRLYRLFLRLTPLFLLLSLLTGGNNIGHNLLRVAAILLHEGGHMLAAHLLGIPVSHLSAGIGGVRLHTGGLYSYRKEFWLCAAGPAANLFSAIFLLLLFRGVDSPSLSYAVAISLTLAVFNLLPLPGFDGGRMLSCLRGSKPTAGYTAAFLLWLLAAYYLLRTGTALSLFLFAVCTCFRSAEKKQSRSDWKQKKGIERFLEIFRA